MTSKMHKTGRIFNFLSAAPISTTGFTFQTFNSCVKSANVRGDQGKSQPKTCSSTIIAEKQLSQKKFILKIRAICLKTSRATF